MSRSVVFIPGNNYQAENYPKLLNTLTSLKLEVFTPRMVWDGMPNPEAWAEHTLRQVDDHDFDIVMGHSFGGATALIVAARLAQQARPFSQLMLCSHSAVFSDDLQVPQVKKWLLDWYGPKSLTPLRGLDITPLTTAVMRQVQRPEVSILYGEQEEFRIRQRAGKTALLFDVAPVAIAGAGHEIENEPYIQAITANLSVD